MTCQNSIIDSEDDCIHMLSFYSSQTNFSEYKPFINWTSFDDCGNGITTGDETCDTG